MKGQSSKSMKPALTTNMNDDRKSAVVYEVPPCTTMQESLVIILKHRVRFNLWLKMNTLKIFLNHPV